MTQGERITTGDDDCGDCLRLGVACGVHAPAATEDAARCLRCRDMRQLVGVPCAAHHVTDCDGEADDGRPSRVEVRAAPRVAGGSPTATAEPGGATVGEGRFAAMLRGLAPAQVLSGDLRSVDNGRDGSGGLREVTAVERAIDRGEGARGRGAWQRASMARGEGRRVLGWLITYARVGDLESLAVLYAAHAAPVALLTQRDLAATAHDAAATGRAKAADAHADAKRVARSKAPEAVIALIAAKLASDRAAGRLASCAAEVARVDAELRAWGLAAMGSAVEAWEDAGEECAA